jgi:hypothetical protein
MAARPEMVMAAPVRKFCHFVIHAVAWSLADLTCLRSQYSKLGDLLGC